MKYLLTTLTTIMAFGMLTVAMPEIAFAGSAKVDVCHIPPGNPDNFHTITISENALQAHSNHGDLAGSCLVNCETVCDDGNFCTQDIVSDPDQCICQPVPGPAVNCDDSNFCTVDSCEPATGCVNDTAGADGITCDDGNPNTENDMCSDGVCEGVDECIVVEGPISSCPCHSDNLNNGGGLVWNSCFDPEFLQEFGSTVLIGSLDPWRYALVFRKSESQGHDYICRVQTALSDPPQLYDVVITAEQYDLCADELRSFITP